MANREDVIAALELFHENRPHKAFEMMDKEDMGTFAVIKYLSHAKGEVTSREISKALGVSSARMAVLVKKLEERNLIIKVNSLEDARAVWITLSEKGKVCAKERKEQMYYSMERIVDEIGIEDLKILFEKLGKIQTILYETRLQQREEKDV